MSKLRRILLLLLPVFFVFLGFTAGYAVRSKGLANKKQPSPMAEKREGGHKLISPLLECDLGETRELQPFKDVVEKFIEDSIKSRKAQRVSVYFRQLNDGQWFTIGDTEKFTPASLRKVPLMIAVLKHSETNPGFLKKKVKFDLMRDHNEYQNIKPREILKRGMEYTIEDLIYRMVVYSDNNALMLLTRTVDPVEFNNIYCMLNMPTCTTSPSEAEAYLSVYTYASFFRILYNASFLNREMSEKALEYLTITDFKDGIIAGVPGNIAVAHKFGENAEEGSAEKQLHDCGIIYYPESPYLLCMMARGDSFENLGGTLSTLSRIVFGEVDKQRQNIWQ